MAGDRRVTNRDRLAFGLALVAIVLVPGLSAAFIHSQGYSTLGSFTWMIGYGSGVVAIWYVWIRPLDLGGSGADGAEDSDSETH